MSVVRKTDSIVMFFYFYFHSKVCVGNVAVQAIASRKYGIIYVFYPIDNYLISLETLARYIKINVSTSET